MSSSSKVAIITGASRGIGHAIAIRLATDGLHVILSARDQAALDQAVRTIEQAGGHASAIALDLREPQASESLVNFALEKAGRIDVIVNNAGATKRGPFAELSDDDWLDGFALKFFGAVRLTRAAWPYLQATRGAIVNIAGSGGRTPGAEFAIGGSVNAAMLSLTKALADAGLPHGIQVNAINPGPIRTARFAKRIAAIAAKHQIELDEAERMFIESERIMHVGEPEQVAALVAFLISPAGRLLHGSLIDADSGATKSI